MSIFGLVLTVFILSLLGIIFLLGVRLRSLRNMTTDEMYQGLVSCEPFLDDFSGISKFSKGALENVYLFSKKIFGRLGLKKYYCHFSNYIHGRHAVENNECEGYWGELNGNGDRKND